ncbi:chromate resistance protein (plasmid) [Deinococcus taeanensis]|uniref:chromate resistance protein ChrB domain-containing protein n=1 Tax=Deinococcus taeanensis TaxID=2737050 RepID=UPI001CDBFD9F|nr:chromate resistance protein ChrB domain-containing protein [Deinococcus taeanensis]UBV44768.1 chromate resistance protein [Deinococcus taeanensis]
MTLWRRLKRLGAITLPGGGAVLPHQPDPHEQLQWLLQELNQAGGEAVILHVKRVEGVTNTALESSFNAARAEDYAELTPLLDELNTYARAPESVPKARTLLDRLRRRHAELQRIDFFQSPAGVQFNQLLTGVERHLRGDPAVPPIPHVDPQQYQRRTWSTRPGPQVDRLASGWLIRRFIDPHATLRYAADPQPGDVTFDRTDGDFTHVGPLCTFEVLLHAFRLEHPALTALADIVHELDLNDGRNVRPETPGVDAVLRGLIASSPDDNRLETQAHALFEGLYHTLTLEGSHDPAT